MDAKLGLIKQNIYDTVRYLRNNDSRAAESFRKYLVEGKNAPGYALTMKSCAMNTNLKQMQEAVKNLESQPGKELKKLTQLTPIFTKLEEAFPKEAEAFDKALQAMYPKTYNKRTLLSSLSSLQEDCITSAKKQKFLKKIFNFFFKD